MKFMKFIVSSNERVNKMFDFFFSLFRQFDFFHSELTTSFRYICLRIPLLLFNFSYLNKEEKQEKATELS